MSKLPSVSGRECVKAPEKTGFRLRRDEPFAQVVVPDHRELDRGTLRAILRGAGVPVEQLIELLG